MLGHHFKFWPNFNPFAAGTMQFQACFRSIEISPRTKFDIYHMYNSIGNQVMLNSYLIQYWRYLFLINIYIFGHLKLEIALAIPASNDEQ